VVEIAASGCRCRSGRPARWIGATVVGARLVEHLAGEVNHSPRTEEFRVDVGAIDEERLRTTSAA
jgi:hypothetical protein